MKQIILAFLGLMLLGFSSCGYESKQYKTMKAKNDSIEIIQKYIIENIKEYRHLIVQLDRNADKVLNDRQGNYHKLNTDLSAEEKIILDNYIEKLNIVLNSERAEVITYKKQLDGQYVKIRQLQNNITRLNQQLEEESAKSVTLQYEIENKNKQLADCDDSVNQLEYNIGDLNTELTEKKEQLTQKEELLNTAYFIAEKKSDLKKNKILTKNKLFEHDFNKKGITKINILEDTTIELPENIKGQILTYHPKSSYRITKQDKKQIINIVNPEKFWSYSKYLVVQ